MPMVVDSIALPSRPDSSGGINYDTSNPGTIERNKFKLRYYLWEISLRCANSVREMLSFDLMMEMSIEGDEIGKEDM